MKKKAIQYTVRGVTRELDQALKLLAKQRGESLNSFILEFLMRQAMLAPSGQIFTDLDHLIGAWVEDPETEKAIEDQRIIDEDIWK